MIDNERKYLTSHPWINFKLYLNRFPYTLWLLLGAAESKCKHLAGIPLSPKKQEEINQISLRKGAQATTAIEGNSLTEDEVKRIVEHDPASFPRSKEYQRIEVENVVASYNDIVAEIDDKDSCSVGYNQLLLDNKAILKNLSLGEEVIPGELRAHSVLVGRYRGAPAEDCDYLLRKLFEWLKEDWGLERDHKIIEGILKAIMAHLYIAWIHPFGDGNGRSARMLEFRMLMAADVPHTAAHLFTTHYNDTRTEYYRNLETTSRTNDGDPVAFLLYALQGFVDALDKQISVILEEQLNVTWSNYVYSLSDEKLTESQARQRKLLLELSAFEKPIEPQELKKRLSSELLGKYDKKTARAFNRDINALEKQYLIFRVKGERKIFAAKDIVRAFLPICRRHQAK